MQVSIRLVVMLIAALPVAGGWKLAGPFGGSARSIAIDPQNHNTLLVGARDSLIFRSDDAAASWTVLPFPSGTPGVFNSIVIHPRDSGHFYAGLDAGDSTDSGLYESMDGGEHWLALPGLRGQRIEALAMWPGDPRVLAAGTSKGVLLSNDGGENWRRVSEEGNPEMADITALAFDPGHWETIYAGTPHLPWKTADGGATWRSIHAGLIDDSDIFSLRVDPERPDLIFASACSGIYRSENAGGSWTKLPGIPGTHRRTHVIAEDPRAADTIFAGTTLGLLKSGNGGRTWRHLTSEQVNWMVFDPVDPGTLYLATEYAGILKSADSGETFRPVNSGFANHSLTQITSDGRRLYASSAYEGRYGGVFVSNDGGFNWALRANEEALGGQNLNSLAAAPFPENLLFAASDEAVLKSSDGGKTWFRLESQPRLRAYPPARIRIHSLAAVRTNKLILFAGTQSGLFRSGNSGVTWEPMTAAGLNGTPVLSLYTAPRGARLAARTSAGVFISEDAGHVWRPALLPDSSYYLYDLALPVDADAPLLAATSRGLLQSMDGGVSWNLVTEYGSVYRSMDGGASWKPFPSDGLENSAVGILWFVPAIPGRILALSAARGALVFDPTQAELAGRDDDLISSKK
jgi:photosystem II stability/assembly factor-like uncharacterized protein